MKLGDFLFNIANFTSNETQMRKKIDFYTQLQVGTQVHLLITILKCVRLSTKSHPVWVTPVDKKIKL